MLFFVCLCSFFHFLFFFFKHGFFLFFVSDDAGQPRSNKAGDCIPVTHNDEIFSTADENTCDAEQLKRVVNNIVGNSVKYMDKAKKNIQLRVFDAGDFIQVEIEDNGKGIPAKEIGSIFERFYRVDKSRSKSTGGTSI